MMNKMELYWVMVDVDLVLRSGSVLQSIADDYKGMDLLMDNKAVDIFLYRCGETQFSSYNRKMKLRVQKGLFTTSSMEEDEDSKTRGIADLTTADEYDMVLDKIVANGLKDEYNAIRVIILEDKGKDLSSLLSVLATTSCCIERKKVKRVVVRLVEQYNISELLYDLLTNNYVSKEFLKIS